MQRAIPAAPAAASAAAPPDAQAPGGTRWQGKARRPSAADKERLRKQFDSEMGDVHAFMASKGYLQSREVRGRSLRGARLSARERYLQSHEVRRSSTEGAASLKPAGPCSRALHGRLTTCLPRIRRHYMRVKQPSPSHVPSRSTRRACALATTRCSRASSSASMARACTSCRPRRSRTSRSWSTPRATGPLRSSGATSSSGWRSCSRAHPRCIVR
jgi:hypothetical protein